MQIIGIDCASDPKNIGIARGLLSETAQPQVNEVGHGLARTALLARLISWLEEDTRTLLALDAPLGWPDALRNGLPTHFAGEELPGDADRLFMRSTDHAIWQRLDKRPLEVGADRIARAARAALSLLKELRQGMALPIPLAWEPAGWKAPAAIEVYPAATLVAHGLGKLAYKKPQQRQERELILAGLQSQVKLSAVWNQAAHSADVLDACLCVLAGSDFLSGACAPPTDLDVAGREGWIWA